MSRALREDIGTGDVTACLIPERTQAQALVRCREPAVLCGIAWFDETFRQLDPAVQVRWRVAEGAAVTGDAVLCELEGPARALLTGERTALNFLQLLSATATHAQRYVAAVAGTGCRILDTRKTIPGLRSAQKYAVRCGGASNHRQGLYDLVLIKENHIAAAGSIGAAVAAARHQAAGVRVEVETEDLAQVREAINAGADIVMLDNFELEQLRTAVALNGAQGRPVLLECSGGITLANVRQIAETGVDYISVGAITKHIAAIDLSMRVLAAPQGLPGPAP
ncbi:MAG TPA: carboxylating nicotinate-nucleotide diphosphorylase [Steroidobacteraceae bacterium]|nr:carboxylating nicotinate-nucleotide diphosphorylase [Steroidobacteraceae bacterium]